MKLKEFLLLILNVLILNVYSQVTTIKYRSETVLETTKYSLDGGVTAAVNGTSRVILKIQLPANTVKWYYVFSSHSDEVAMNAAAEKIKAVSLSTNAVDPTGTTASFAAALFAPSGSEQCNVLVFPTYDDAKRFEDKTELSIIGDDAPWEYYPLSSIKAATEGKMVLANSSEETLYLGIQNPSMSSPIKVAIEVIAIVQEVQEATDDEQKGANYGNMGWKCFERGEYDKCLDLSTKAISLNKSLGFVHFNLGLTYLVKDSVMKALDFYNTALVINRKTDTPKSNLEGALNDLSTYMDKVVDKAMLKDIQSLIERELSQY